MMWTLVMPCTSPRLPFGFPYIYTKHFRVVPILAQAAVTSREPKRSLRTSVWTPITLGVFFDPEVASDCATKLGPRF
jgi:hypothetical protein